VSKVLPRNYDCIEENKISAREYESIRNGRDVFFYSFGSDFMWCTVFVIFVLL
jgi:hypothetical protein